MLSPLDLYCEERMITLVSGWCWQGRLADDGEAFERLPRAVAAAWPEDDLPGHAIRRPLDDAQWRALHEALTTHANRELRERVERARQCVERLAHCPVCDAPAATFAPSAGGFYAHCGHCNAVWELRGPDQRFIIRLSECSQDFQAAGRFAIDLAL